MINMPKKSSIRRSRPRRSRTRRSSRRSRNRRHVRRSIGHRRYSGLIGDLCPINSSVLDINSSLNRWDRDCYENCNIGAKVHDSYSAGLGWRECDGKIKTNLAEPRHGSM